MVLHFAVTAVLFLFCVAVIYGAISDVTTYTIPNWVSYGIAMLFFVFAALTWARTPILVDLGFGLLTFVICVVFWRLKWLGGGDVKFVSAVALWMGPEQILLFTVLLAGLSAIFVAILQYAKQWNAYIQQSGFTPGFIKQMVQKAEEHACPYGLPAAIAALVVVPDIVARSQ